MSLLSLPDARQALKIAATDHSVDAELQTYVDAITTVVENHVGEVIDPRAVTERLRLPGGTNRFVLKHCPVLSLTSVIDVRGNAYDTTYWDVDPSTGVVEVYQGEIPCGTVIAEYQAGYETPPNNYKRGAVIILQHIWETQRGVGNALNGVVGLEERMNRMWMYDIPRKALEWLGPPAPSV